MTKALKSIRIFISSPGDVAEERALTKRVIQRLQGEFSGKVILEPIYWEHEPLLATQSFQEQIIRPSETDIVITILWSRLGTRLPATFTKPDGSRYESGTEFEFEDAIKSFRDRGTPDLLIYRKTTDPQVSLKDKQKLLEKLKQKEALDNFFDKWFHDKAEGTLIAAFHPFNTSADFEEIFENHLYRLIKLRLPESAVSDKVAAIKPQWEAGSPFRGLNVFNFEHSPVFFGRTKAVSEIIDALRIQAASEKAFILILGMSGGGKSSLVRAGVLPMLTQPGVIEGVGLWRRAIMKPGDSPGDLFDGLAACLLQEHALPELGADRTDFKELASLLRETPKAVVPLIKGGLSQAASEMAKAEELTEQPTARLVLVVDQMEEMFSLESITHDERKKFIEAIDALSCCGRVWVIATLRSDFYPGTSELEGLIALKEGSGQYDLLAPTPAEIGQMIRQPAQAAGLYFEEDTATNEGLDDVLRDAAAKNPGALPLLEFTLEELYKQRTDDGMLTYEAYKKLGGVEGALAQRAEEVFGGLEPRVQKVMDVELHSLISIGVDDAEKISRKYAPLEMVTATPETKAFVEAFVKARLFTTDLAADGSAVVNIAHEALLQHWPRLQDWIEKNRESLRIHARINAAARRWENENKSREFLLSAGKQVSEAEELVKNKRIELTDTEKKFVHASIAKSRRIYWIKRAVAAVLVILTIVASGAAYLAMQQRDRAKTEAQTAEQVSEFLVGLFEVSDPSEALGDTITAREILDKGAERIENELADQPEVQARLMSTMASVYHELGLYDKAELLYENALEKKQKVFGNKSIETAMAINNLATLLHEKGDFHAAESLFLESIALTKEIIGEEDTLFAECLINLGNHKSDIGQYEEADSLFKEAMEIYSTYFGEDNPNTLRVLNSMAGLKWRQGDLKGAEPIFRKIVEVNKSIYGEKNPEHIRYLNNLAGLNHHLGYLSTADSMFRIVVSLTREVYGNKHPEFAARLNNLGMVLEDKGEYEEAQQLYREALSIDRKTLGTEHPSFVIHLNNYASLMSRMDKMDSAEIFFTEALKISQVVNGHKHQQTATLLNNLAQTLEKNGKLDDAEDMFKQSLEIFISLVGNEHPAIATLNSNIAVVIYKKGDTAQAKAIHQEALEMRRKLLGNKHPAVAESLYLLAKLEASQENFDEAVLLYRECLDIRKEVFPDHSRNLRIMAMLASCLISLNEFEEAEGLLLQCYPLLIDKQGMDHEDTIMALNSIIDLYQAWDKPEKVAKYEALMPDTTAVSETQ